MKVKHIIVASLSLLIVFISVGFGISISNANSNQLITEWNEFENIQYFDVQMVPKLSYFAALLTLPLILIVLVFELLILKEAKVRQVKNISIGLLIAIAFILIFDILTIYTPAYFEFSKWGFIWITMGMVITAGNVLSIFIREKKRV
jgi:hypothetical protein